MAKLVYSVISSLDAYIADDDDSFDWAVPDEEVLAFINDLERPVGTYLYGRRMYEMMVAWETDPSAADQSPRSRDLAGIRHAADKVVYSGTLEAVSTTRTQMERDFDPEAVRQIKASAGRDVSVSGPDLAAHAFTDGLVDECHLFVAPITVGSGKRSLPTDVRVRLELLAERRFGNGIATRLQTKALDVADSPLELLGGCRIYAGGGTGIRTRDTTIFRQRVRVFRVLCGPSGPALG